MRKPIEVTILMPCLNEAETIAACIEKALLGLERAGVAGEVLVADNGSSDDSAAIAAKAGARVVSVEEKGYGSALRGGVAAAQGKWIIMGDADDSYDFSRIEAFVQKLRDGYDLVMGCRLPSGGGRVMPGAMPWKNRWIGTPILSFIGRLFFKCPAKDFNCGLRGFTRTAYDQMDLKTTGMEFASEMIIKARLRSLRVGEVPITLHKDGRSRPPHLNPWRDGWRHLRFMLIYSPLWLFLIPGILMALVGVAAMCVLTATSVRIGNVQLDVGSLTVAAMAVIVGLQLIVFAGSTKVFAIGEGLLPPDPKFAALFKYLTLEKGITAGLTLMMGGFVALAYAFAVWKSAHYGALSYAENLRRLIPAMTLITAGIQIIFSSFFFSVLGLKTSSRRPPEIAAATTTQPLEKNPRQ
jgi:Glycosyl transferase family 2